MRVGVSMGTSECPSLAALTRALRHGGLSRERRAVLASLLSVRKASKLFLPEVSLSCQYQHIILVLSDNLFGFQFSIEDKR